MKDEETLSALLTEAYEKHPYKDGTIESVTEYNEGWCDAIDFIARMLGVEH